MDYTIEDKQLKRIQKRQAKQKRLQKRIDAIPSTPTWKEQKKGWKRGWQKQKVIRQKRRAIQKQNWKNFGKSLEFWKVNKTKKYSWGIRRQHTYIHPQAEPYHHEMTNVATAVTTR